MESIYASEPSEPTVDDEPTMESASPPKHLVNVVAMANGLYDIERTPAGKGRRCQSRTCCRNRQSRQTNRYLAHDDAHCSDHPAFENQTRQFPTGCSRAAQSRSVGLNKGSDCYDDRYHRHCYHRPRRPISECRPDLVPVIDRLDEEVPDRNRL
jgi:hypothetical protein